MEIDRQQARAKELALDKARVKALPWSIAAMALNGVFCMWTFGGSVFVLFLSELGLPKGQIGILLSSFPFCGMVALWFAPIATRLGWKRVFIAGYSIRKFVFAGLLLLPWMFVHVGRPTALVFLFIIVFSFAFLRALAETAYYPWLQEFVPNRVRGRYTAANMFLITLASCAALLIASHIIRGEQGLGRFLVLIAAGIGFGLAGLSLMFFVPGGEARPAPTASGHRTEMATALTDPNFRYYLTYLGCYTMGTLMLTSFLPLYLKEQLGIVPGSVVLLDIGTMLGGLTLSLVWGWASDKVGGRLVVRAAGLVILLVPIGWAVLPRAHVAISACVGLYIIYGALANGANIGGTRLLFNSVVPKEKGTAYIAIYYAWIGLTGGAAPILAGNLLSLFSGWGRQLGFLRVDGHTVLFAISVAFLVTSAFMSARIRSDAPAKRTVRA